MHNDKSWLIWQDQSRKFQKSYFFCCLLLYWNKSTERQRWCLFRRALELYDSCMGYLQYIWAWYKIEIQLCRRMVKRRASKSWLNHSTLATLIPPDIQHNKSLETAHKNTLGCSAVINAIFFTHRKKVGDEWWKELKGWQTKGSYVSLTIVSFPLLTIGAGDTQNAVDGVGSYGIVGGTGHRRGGCAGHWRRKQS